MIRNKKDSILGIVALVTCVVIMLTLVSAETYNVTGRDTADVTFQSEAIASNVPPHIDNASFSMEIIAEKEVYPTGERANATIPFAFTGENITFTIDVIDNNGEEDIAAVTIFLSEDETVNESDISISLDAVESTKNGDTRLTFTKSWNVPAFVYGRKNIFITVNDSGGLPSDNNEIKIGELFINPMIGFEIVNSTGGDVESIQFAEGPPGTTNVSAQSLIQIKNIDPDSVGMKLKVLIKGTDLVNMNGTGSISISNMKVDGKSMSTALQVIDECLAPGESKTHMFSLDYPLPLPAGRYVGTVTFEIKAL